MKKILICLFIVLIVTQTVNAQITVERNFSYGDPDEMGVYAPLYVDVMNFTFMANTGSGLFLFTNLYDFMAGINFETGPSFNRILLGRRYQKYFDDPITIFSVFSRTNIHEDFYFSGTAGFSFYPEDPDIPEIAPEQPEGTNSHYKLNLEYFITDSFYINGGLHVVNWDTFSPLAGLGGKFEF